MSWLAKAPVDNSKFVKRKILVKQPLFKTHVILLFHSDLIFEFNYVQVFFSDYNRMFSASPYTQLDNLHLTL